MSEIIISPAYAGLIVFTQINAFILCQTGSIACISQEVHS